MFDLDSSPYKYNIRPKTESLSYKNLRLYILQQRVFSIVSKIVLFVLVFGLSFVILYPFLKLLPLVFNNLEDVGTPDVIWIPRRFSVQSFRVAAHLLFNADNLVMVKSLLYALSIAAIQTAVSAMAGYSLARVDFKGRQLVFALVILTFVIPPQATLISQYLRFKDFDVFGIMKLIYGRSVDLINKPISLYLLAAFGFGLKQSLFVFIFRQFFYGMPTELEEAALIDGCGFYGTFFRVMLPNAVPAIMTVLIFAFVWNYGDNYYVNYFHPDGPYLSIMLDRTFQETQFDFVKSLSWNRFDILTFNTFTFDAIKQAALIIYLIPLLILYFVVQRRFVETFERSGIVG
ncbi:MAG: carbohydrate ABC transporter permease [Bacillota bacterium]|jgi:multiple sugar transport system permease protein|nr:carbohydrate ABC transporter permease [Bacillota bacterium]HOB91195.1 carbohydrate ABC transporter permease [Bacillota bacterium]HPZ54322.1 carbohydrate ABC transporter permease [Bacillota bacterium]HQD17605.1 carbohydrate ABC transporter permease [Bacillota bacterium]